VFHAADGAPILGCAAIKRRELHGKPVSSLHAPPIGFCSVGSSKFVEGDIHSAQARRTFRYKSAVNMPPPSLSPERVKVADAYADRSGVIPPLPWPSIAPALTIEAIPTVAVAPNERWSTDLCRDWAGRGGWTTLALVIDCHTRELLGWHLSRSGKTTTAASALEHALINRFGTLGKVPQEFLLWKDNGLVFTSRRYTALVRSYGLKPEFITPHCPQQNGMVERVIWTLKEQCIHRQRFDSIQHATRAIGDWISFYNHRRPHQAMDMKTPAEALALAA